MINDKIILNFIVERGEPINDFYFSARIKLAPDSKSLLQEKLGNVVQFNHLDDYFNLDPENFYIYHNKYRTGVGGRDELCVKNKNGIGLVYNMPLNSNGFSVELSQSQYGSLDVDYGFYPLYVMCDPVCSNRINAKKFNDNNELLPTTINILDYLLSNTESLTTQEICYKVQNEIAEAEARVVREKRQTEEEREKRHEEIKELVENGEILLFKLIRGEEVDNKRTSVLLQIKPGQNIALDPNKYYIEEEQGMDYFHYVGKEQYIKLRSPDTSFFVLNNSYYGLKSEWYEIGLDKYYGNLRSDNYSFWNESCKELSDILRDTLRENNLLSTLETLAEDEKLVKESNDGLRENKEVDENATILDNLKMQKGYEENDTKKMTVSSDDYEDTTMLNIFKEQENKIRKERVVESSDDDREIAIDYQRQADENKDLQQENGYYSEIEAEQMIKFLESRHPDLLNKLVKEMLVLRDFTNHELEANKLIENFMQDIKIYHSEFSQWIDDAYLNMKYSIEDINRSHEKRADEQEIVAEALKVKAGKPIEAGKYEVELNVAYEDVQNFHNAVLDKYNTKKEYSYEQAMVLYNEIVAPAAQNYEKSITLQDIYIADDHIFIQNHDFGTLRDFNDMFF